MFKPTNADDDIIKSRSIMKTLAKILAGILLLAVIYFIAADGMMVHFGLTQGIQYAFNYAALLLLIPFCIFVMTQGREAYEK